MRAKQVYENIRFERGKDPKRALAVGKYSNPKVVLFEEIHEYCENEGWPGFEKTTPIEWEWEEPTFQAISIPDKGLKWSKVKTYTLYLTENAVKCFVEYTDKDGTPDQDEYTVESFKHWIRILETNHTKRLIPVTDTSGSMTKIGPSYGYGSFKHIPESVNFERGQDPKTSMGLGKAANPFVIYFAEREVDDDGYVTGPLPEDHSQNTWF